MEPIYKDIELLKRKAAGSQDQAITYAAEPIRHRVISPGIVAPGIPQPYPADEDLMPPLDISVPKGLPGGLKMWHLLVAVGVLFFLKKR